MARIPNEQERLVEAQRPRFYAYLMALGKSDKERGDALSIRRDMVEDYRTGKAMPRFFLVTEDGISDEVRARRAELVQALAEDLAAAFAPRPRRRSAQAA